MTVTCVSVRALLRPSPAGRSLKIESLLLSKPVVMLYGVPVLPASDTVAFRFFTACEFSEI